jgi:uncharacterized cupin superfamily protein
MANVFEPEWDMERDEPPYRWRRARLGRQVGLEKLGASLFELPPGAASFPLHAHLHNEEAIVVLRGRPTLRTLEGERVLEPGDVVGCPAGRAGAHRLDNATDEPVRVLVVSTMLAPEVVEFPDEGVFWVRDYVPGHDRPDDAVDVRTRPEGA